MSNFPVRMTRSQGKFQNAFLVTVWSDPRTDQSGPVLLPQGLMVMFIPPVVSLTSRICDQKLLLRLVYAQYLKNTRYVVFFLSFVSSLCVIVL